VTSPAQYGDLLKALADGGLHRAAAPPSRGPQAYAHTAAYDAAVSSWFAASYAPDEVAQETGWPDLIAQVWTPLGRAPLRREPAPAGGDI